MGVSKRSYAVAERGGKCGGLLANFSVVTPSDHLRARVEDEIRTTYWERFQARLARLPRTLVASVSTSGIIECAAGVRFSEHDFFSECYLDLPVEIALQHRFGLPVQRRRIIEVCNLAGRKPGRSQSFIASFIEFAEFGRIRLGDLHGHEIPAGAARAQRAANDAIGPRRAVSRCQSLRLGQLLRARSTRDGGPSRRFPGLPAPSPGPGRRRRMRQCVISSVTLRAGRSSPAPDRQSSGRGIAFPTRNY